jgi:RNA polymerase sigma-70 factor, ECF subfamily
MVARVDTFERYRYLLFSIAYRMVGSAMDAEDLVQEAYLRWQRVANGELDNPSSYLTTVVTRLAIDHYRSARVQREQYVGSWLPEPILTEVNKQVTHGGDPVALADTVSMAFLVLLETLSPTQRAVFLLHDVFDFPYSEIAAILRQSEVSCRQMASRARAHLRAGRPRFEVAHDEHEALTTRFLQSCATGDLDALVAMLTPEVVSWADSGGEVSAIGRPMLGADRVARLFVRLWQQRTPSMHWRYLQVNNQPGFAIYDGDTIVTVVVLDVVDGLIAGIRAVLNPQKLQHINRTLGAS